MATKTTYRAVKVWKVGELSLVQEESERRRAAMLACDGLASLRPVARSFVHSSPTHKELWINGCGKRFKFAAVQCGFKVYPSHA